MSWPLVQPTATLLPELLVRLIVYCRPAILTALGSVGVNAPEVASEKIQRGGTPYYTSVATHDTMG